MLKGKEISCAYNFFSGYGDLKLTFKGGWSFVDKYKEVTLSDDAAEYINALRYKANELGVELKVPDDNPKCTKCGGLRLCRVDNGRCISCMVTQLSPRQRAIKDGKQWYIPTTPCDKCGLLVERNVTTGACSNCISKGVDRRSTAESELMRAQPDAIITKKQAKTMGLKVYRTGKPCKNGHTGWRYVSTNSCIDCLRGK